MSSTFLNGSFLVGILGMYMLWHENAQQELTVLIDVLDVKLYLRYCFIKNALPGSLLHNKLQN